MYMNFYGTVRSYLCSKVRGSKIVLMVCLGMALKPFKIVLELGAVLWGLFTPKIQFVVVDKDFVGHKEVPNTI